MYVNRRASLEWKHQSDHKVGVSLWYLLNTFQRPNGDIGKRTKSTIQLPDEKERAKNIFLKKN